MSNEVAKRDNITEIVAKKVKVMLEKGELELPPGYSAPNALKAAYLILKDKVDRNKRPVLEVCTQESIALSLLNMVVLGLYPEREQIYFIPYGSKLTSMPSYMGKLAIAKRLNPHLADIFTELIFDGDEIEISLYSGRKTVTYHKQKFCTPTIDNIIGAYAVAVDRNGEAIQTVVMTKDEILKSWRQSQQRPFADDGSLKPNTVHAKFPGEMAKRTAANRLTKMLINTAVHPDSVLDRTIQEIEIEATESELDAAIAGHAGKTAIGFSEQESEKTRKKPSRPRKAKPAPEPSPEPEVDPLVMEIDEDKVTVSESVPDMEEELPPNVDDDPFNADPGF